VDGIDVPREVEETLGELKKLRERLEMVQANTNFNEAFFVRARRFIFRAEDELRAWLKAKTEAR
jgi:hypothetical protein